MVLPHKRQDVAAVDTLEGRVTFILHEDRQREPDVFPVVDDQYPGHGTPQAGYRQIQRQGHPLSAQRLLTIEDTGGILCFVPIPPVHAYAIPTDSIAA